MSRKRHARIDPIESAKAAGLRYVSDATPGYRRKTWGGGFVYIDADGHPIRDKKIVKRMRTLVIPPAWKDVWICPSENGHIQVTARDARGRKQYRYHPKWRAVRDEDKYEHMIAFGEALPALRKRIDEDLAERKLSRAKVLGTVVRLLELTLIRVGNEEYARDNESFGLTTLRDRHVRISGTKVTFKFKGKSGKEHEVEVADRRLAAIVKRVRALPGQDLFQYLDDDGTVQSISSSDVNDYLREVMGGEFTAKDFRTWAGTVMASQILSGAGEETDANRRIVAAVKSVAQRLGNTPATCRKHYIHPLVLAAFAAGKLAGAEEKDDLAFHEAAVLKLLKAG
ncbi:MAG TPA: hypothetical protein VFV19_17920 [Candidatus Polarisedimenticolaceae bacterium]|nr:hypothetical protein [Candidatus Polarisedimenticolaceae bacterium]